MEDIERMLREFANKNGLQIVNPGKSDIATVVEEELPRIEAVDPGFFVDREIYLPEDFARTLRDLYGERAQDAAYVAKVWLRQIGYAMIDCPDNRELALASEQFEKLLDGTYFKEELEERGHHGR